MIDLSLHSVFVMIAFLSFDWLEINTKNQIISFLFIWKSYTWHTYIHTHTYTHTHTYMQVNTLVLSLLPNQTQYSAYVIGTIGKLILKCEYLMVLVHLPRPFRNNSRNTSDFNKKCPISYISGYCIQYTNGSRVRKTNNLNNWARLNLKMIVHERLKGKFYPKLLSWFKIWMFAPFKFLLWLRHLFALHLVSCHKHSTWQQ